uniref:Si:dkey-30c15.13 n=1 Tax=Scophthalmus maximus TaxID=52904 RepID=A0A8D2ZSP0_SCOMX
MWIKACHSNIWVWLFSSAVILLVGSLLAQQMMQNMFQEGLYHVFFKETPAACPPAEATDHEELDNVRIHRWFGTVVNTRLLVAGVVQVLSALVCTLATVTHACVSYNCSVSMTTPVWSSLCYVAAGFLAIEVQRRANRLKVNRAGSYVAKGTSVAFSVLCFLSSVYILLLSWRGLRRYSAPNTQAYNRLTQVNKYNRMEYTE